MDSTGGGYEQSNPHIFGNKGGDVGNLELELLSFYGITTVIMMIFIVAVYTIGIYWNFRFLKIIEKNNNVWIIVYSIILCAFMIAAYAFLLVKIFIGNPVDTNVFAAIVIRPMFLALGFNLIANARARYVSYKNNRPLWNLRGKGGDNGSKLSTNSS